MKKKNVFACLGVLLVVALIVRLGFISLDLIPWWDSIEYALNAKFFAGQQIYFSSLRPPLLSLLMSPLHSSYELMSVFNALLAVASIAMVFVFTSEFFGKKTALFTSAILATNFLFALRSYQISTESGIIFFTFLVLYAFAKARKDPKWLYYAGACSGLAFLFRYPMALVALVSFGWYLYTKKENTLEKIRENWEVYAKTGLAGFLVILPWLAFNQIFFGLPIFSMLEGIGVFAKSYAMFQPIDYYLTHVLELANILVLAFFVFGVLRKENLKDEKGLLVAWLLVGLFFFHLQGVKEMRYLLPILPVIMFFAVVGMEKAFSVNVKLKGKEWLIVLLIVLSNLAYTGYYMQDAYQDRILRTDGVKPASQYLNEISEPDDIIYTNFWPEVAYYSERHSKGIFPFTTKEEFEENLKRSDYVLVGSPHFENEIINNTYLDTLEQLEYVGTWGGPFKDNIVYVYKIKEGYKNPNPVYQSHLWAATM